MKTRISIFMLAVMLALLLAACGTPSSAQTSKPVEPTPTEAPVFDLEEYKTLVSECRVAINDAAIFLANAGKYETNWLKAYASVGGDGGIDDLAEKAFEWLAENSEATRETVDADYEDIRQQYKNIILMELDGQEAQEIDALFRSMYEAYSSMYSLVTKPSGTASSFASSLVDCINELTKADEDLSLFLD